MPSPEAQPRVITEVSVGQNLQSLNFDFDSFAKLQSNLDAEDLLSDLTIIFKQRQPNYRFGRYVRKSKTVEINVSAFCAVAVKEDAAVFVKGAVGPSIDSDSPSERLSGLLSAALLHEIGHHVFEKALPRAALARLGSLALLPKTLLAKVAPEDMPHEKPAYRFQEQFVSFRLVEALFKPSVEEMYRIVEALKVRD